MNIEKRDSLIEQIRKAFKGVMLEDGIGLHEAKAFDEYAGMQARMLYRQKDQVNDWSAIPVEELEFNSDNFAFFDPKGWRFHLPALLIAQLEGKSVEITGYLTDFWDEEKYEHLKKKFDILTAEQHNAVRNFLIEMLNEPESITFQEEFKKALSTY